MAYEVEPLPAPIERPAWMRGLIRGLQTLADGITHHWLWVVNGFFALLLGGALLTPVLMQMGLEGPGRVLYTIYSFTCHQLPERSYFLFTPDKLITTYTLNDVVAAGADDTNVLTLRQFVGSPEFGWKAGFSDRMFSMYGGMLLGGLLYAALSRRRFVSPLPFWLFVLMVLPMGIDGLTHMMSEIPFSPIFGARESNAWALSLFPGQPAEFFTGTTTGSLNATLRLITGLLFGVGAALFAYPYLGMGFYDIREEADYLQTARTATTGVPSVEPPPGPVTG